MTWAPVFGLILLIGSISDAKHAKVIGGHNTVITQYPYIVSIRVDGSHICGGSIISDRHILTAAHCVFDLDDFDKKHLTIHSGASNTGKKGTVHMAQSYHVHPKWEINDSKSYPNDIALITLEHPMTFNKHQQKIKLPSHDVKNYQVADLVGWGKMSRSERIRPRQLQKLRTVLLTSVKCQPLITHKITPNQVCGFRSEVTGSCHGDSGGPLASNGEIVGLVSFGDTGLCANDLPDVYTNVFAYREFIESVMNE